MSSINLLIALFAFPLAHAQNAAPTCKGLGDNGSYSTNLDKHRKQFGSYCADGGPLAAREKNLVSRLNYCQKISDLIWKNGRKVSIFDSTPGEGSSYGDKILKRRKAACEAYKGYVESSTKICAGADAAAANQATVASSIDSAPGNQAAEFATMAKNLNGVSTSYGTLKTAAHASGEDVVKNLPNLRPAQGQSDQEMWGNVENLKNLVKSFTTYVRDQSNKKLKAREAHAQDQNGDDNLGAIRFRTRADYQTFDKAVDECSKSVNLLDSYNKDYQKQLADDVSKMKAEATQAETYFGSTGEAARKAAAANQLTATRFAAEGRNPDAPAGSTITDASSVLPVGQGKSTGTSIPRSPEEQQAYKSTFTSMTPAQRMKYVQLGTPLADSDFTDSTGSYHVYSAGSGAMLKTWAVKFK